MPLLETDALTIRSTFDSLPDEAKPLASDWMKRYKDQQDEFGLPLFPSEVETQQADESAFVSMFDDVKLVDPGNGIYDQAERLKSGEGDRLRQREAGMRFLAKHGDEEKVRRDFPLYRDDFAMKNGGKRDMGDGEFYSFVSQQVKRQQGQKLVRSRSLDAGFRAAIEGMGSLEKLAAVKSEAAASADSEVDAGAFLEAYGETQKVMSKHAAFIREYSDAIMANMDGGSINLEPLNERLLDMPGTERRMVIAALNLEAQKQGKKVKADKGDGYGKALSQMLQGAFMGASEEGSKFWQQTGEAAGRLARSAAIDQPRIERLISSIPDTGEVMAPGAIKTAKDAQAYVREALMRSDVAEASAMAAGTGGVGALPVDDNRTTITLDETAQRLIQDAKEREMKRLRVANEIRSIGEAADPIPNVFASTIGTSGAALALMAGTRGLAAPALANAYTNIEFNDLSLKYPQMSTADKTQIAAISGAAQAALDYVGVKALDKLPGIKSLIAQPLTKQLAGRALARGAMSFGQENLVEAGQDIATPALMQALKSDVPGFDWEAEQREFWKGRADVAIGLLPLTLLGIGAASVNEYRGAKNLLSYNDQLGAAGVVETDRVAVIEAAQSGDVGKAQSLLMEAWGRRNPEVAAEYQDAMSQRQTDMSRATAELERLGAIPTLRRDGEGWTVTSNGTSTKFATWEEARDVATAAMGDMERAQTELVASLSDSFMASTPGFLKGESVEFNTDAKGESLVDRVNAGAMTPEQAMEAAVAGGVIKGVTMQEARAIAAEVFGGQNASERAMQFRQDVEKIAVLGRNTVQNGQSRSIVNAAGNERSFLTVVEEVVEGRWKGGLERRAFTKDMGIRWVQLAEAATGETFLEGSTWGEIAASAELAPRALTEAISRIVVADVLGRMKDGKRIGPGTVSSGLNLNDREQSALAAILDAFRKLFRALLETASKLAKARQEGKLGGEYDALFDALTGGSSQLEHDAAAAKEADAIASEAVDTSGYSPETPGPNGETFSMASASGAAQNAEPSPGGLSEAVDIGASWHKFRDLPDDALVLMKHVTNEDAARTIAREGFNQARKVWKGSEEGFVFLGSTSATNLGIYGAYATQRFGGKPASVIVAVRKGDLLPDDGPDWKAQMKNKSSRSFVAEQFGKDKITKPSAVAAFAELGQLKAKPSNVQVVRILEENGKPVETFSLGKITPAQDAEYLAAVEAGDMETAQRMVDEAAKAAGYNVGPVWQGHPDETGSIYRYDLPNHQIQKRLDGTSPTNEFGFWIVDDKDAAKAYSYNRRNFGSEVGYYGQLRKLHLKLAQPLDLRSLQDNKSTEIYTEDFNEFLKKNGVNFQFDEDETLDVWHKFERQNNLQSDLAAWMYFEVKSSPKLKKAIRDAGYDGVILNEVHSKFDLLDEDLGEVTMGNFLYEGDPDPETIKNELATDYVVFDPAQIKSADPITRDADGNVIPLSQRFNPADNRITYSIRPGDFSARMEAKFSLFQAKPELRLGGRRDFMKGLAASLMFSQHADAGPSLGDAMKGVGTKLTSEEEAKFQQWKAKYAPLDSGSDYDLRGAFKEGITPGGERGHFPDTYKLPNHPTFSKESKYSTPEHPGGEWGERNGHTTFTPSPWMAGDADRMEELKKYFKEVEPDAELIMPDAGSTFSLGKITPAQDAEYMQAVEAGDMEKAQRMVDEAAKAAGYDIGPMFHGGADGFNVFSFDKMGEQGTSEGMGFYFTNQEQVARGYVKEQGGRLMRVWLKNGKRLNSKKITINKAQLAKVLRKIDPKGDDFLTNYGDVGYEGYSKVLNDAVSNLLDYSESDVDLIGGIINSGASPQQLYKFIEEVTGKSGMVTTAEDGGWGEAGHVITVITSPEYVKLADPVTRDESGNVIPLSQRFNPADNRITFSIRPGDFSARMEAKFSLFQAKPELRLAIAQVAKERALRLGAEWIAKGDVIRSAKDIGREARMREALAYEARMNEYLDGLSENARQTLEFEPSALEDDPLVAAMLDFGKLMSFTTAKKSGKVEAKSGDYDGQPWLPPAWFSKGAGIMPDQMAQAMFDAGMLPDAYTGTLWSELEKRIEATRKDKAAHREAVQAYKAAEKYARDASRAEADQWAENAKKQAGSPKAQRDMLKAALRTLDGILAAAPPEVRARVGGYVKLAGLATDEAMLQEIERRIDKLNVELEKYLKKQAVAEITKLFKKARPDMEAGKKGKGKDADMHALFAAAEAAADMDALAVAGRLADLDARIASGELTAEQEALAMTERGIVELVGDLKNADSGRAFSALDTLRDIYGGAWLKWKIAEIERKERRAGLRQDFIVATGKAGVRTERTKADKVNESLYGKGKAWLLNLSSMREVLAYAFGLDNERVTSLVDAERTASNTYEDANQRLGDEIEGLFTEMAGTRTKGERLRWNLSQRTIKTGKGELSQLEAIQALLMWRQEDGRRHMEGTRDESGKVTSSWSYDQAWIDEIEAALTPEARQVMSFIMGKYAAEWATLNPLYRARYGVNMPHHDAYAPITVTPVQTKAGEVVDPVTGSAVSGGSILTPGSLRTRSRNAIAEPDFRDALQTMILHSRQMEYWKAYYDLAVEMNAVLGNREVMNSVHAKGGKEAANALRQWIDVIGQGGFRDASLRLALFQAGSKLQGRAAGVALLGRMSAILSQSTQLAAAAVKMPVTSYLVRLAKLMTGGLGWRDAMRSDFIQRRFKTAPPIVRQAMDSLASAKPNEIQQLSRFFGNVLSGADAFFTSGTYAILLDYHREQGRAAGLTGAELDAYAHTEAERATEQVAQPTRTANRSLAELSNTGPLGKIGWAFASEARQKVALAAHAALNAKNDPVTAAKSAFLTFAIGGLFTQVLKNLLREAKGDDDGEMWSLGRLGYAMTIAPLASAIPFGSAIAGDSNMLSNIQRAIQTLGNEEVDFSDVDAMLSAAGLFNDTAASLAQLSHLGLDLGKILANAAD